MGTTTISASNKDADAIIDADMKNGCLGATFLFSDADRTRHYKDKWGDEFCVIPEYTSKAMILTQQYFPSRR